MTADLIGPSSALDGVRTAIAQVAPTAGSARPHRPNQWSTSTRHSIASTITTARGSTQASWRPRGLIVAGRPSRSTVSCSRIS